MLHLHRDGSRECWQWGVWKTIVDCYSTSKCFSQLAPIKREKPKTIAMVQETSEDFQESQAGRIEILWLSKNKTIYDPKIGMKKAARFGNIQSNTDPLLKRNGKLDIEAESRVAMCEEIVVDKGRPLRRLKSKSGVNTVLSRAAASHNST